MGERDGVVAYELVGGSQQSFIGGGSLIRKWYPSHILTVQKWKTLITPGLEKSASPTPGASKNFLLASE